jgi:hypothetical protein
MIFMLLHTPTAFRVNCTNADNGYAFGRILQ